jgi:ABC-type transporter Mla MlaB component
MLKIQATRETGADRTVALIGTIQTEYLAELEDVVRRAARDRRRLSFDLSQVRLVDRDAVRFLVSAVERQVRLTGCPTYLREWLRSERHV